MEKIYVVGGQYKKNAQGLHEWNRFKKAVVMEFDLEKNKQSKFCIEYTSPSGVAPDSNPSYVFKAGTLMDGKLYVCTQTEVLIYDMSTYQRVGYITLPSFNDLHHVRPDGHGNLLIVSTGLDMLIKVNMQGQILKEWGVLNNNNPWERFSKCMDYRKVPSTKPHKAHPNYVFLIGEDIWVTRFVQRDAICLTEPGKNFNINVQSPHDGVVHKSNVLFTTVDGHVVIIDLLNGEVSRVVDLNEITKSNKSLGWCRGLKVVDDSKVIVGFSRIRPTKIRENLRWVKHRVGLRETVGNLPTRIVLFDLKNYKTIWEHNLEELGMGAIFSIH